MNDVEKVRECLHTILIKGDLYDTIAEREGVKAQKHSFIRNHIFLLSRILYVGVRLGEKLKSLFSPIDEVKNAQDTIRKILGVNVDFVKTKHRFDLSSDIAFSSDELFKFEKVLVSIKRTKNPELSILYENSNVRAEEYVEHLKKILRFCELYGIGEVLLRESDIIDLFPIQSLDSYIHITKKELLDCEYLQFPPKNDKHFQSDYDFDSIFLSYLLLLKKEELRELIKLLEVEKISKQVVGDFAKRIEDETTKKAITEFLIRGELGRLKETVSSRLALLINSDSSYKDKVYGKVFQNVVIKDEFINIISTNQEGAVISNIVTTLYDYLGILDYKSLMREIKMQGDNQQILAMTALQLYLCQKIKIKGLNNSSTSFYDYVYENFKIKRKRKLRMVPGLYKKIEKKRKDFSHVFSNAIITFFLACIVVITGTSIDFIEQIAFNRDTNVLENMTETILNPYLKSLDFEKELVNGIMGFIETATLDFSNLFKSINGDVDGEIVQSDKQLAVINNLSDVDLPVYFANGYATSAEYSGGKIEYIVEQPLVDISDFRDIQGLFEVSIYLDENILKQFIVEDEFRFSKLFYPLGTGDYTENYVLTQIYIYDPLSDSKVFEVDGHRFSLTGNKITYFEKETLQSLHYAKLVYVYGIDYGINPFVEDLNKDGSYTKEDPDIIRKKIIEGLELDENASDEEIYSAIMSKEYSTTPIKDAGMSLRIKWMNEKKYFKTIASLDSLVCNLAATLAVGTDEELIYTVGYYNANDRSICANEAHAWAMSPDGRLIDITPSVITELEEEENAFLINLISWGIENHIPLYTLLAYTTYLFNKIFGKKVRFYLNLRKVEKILIDSDIEESYAKLRETLYGGINIPCKRTPTELLEAIERDFGSFSLEELKALREELQSDFNNEGELDSALQLLNKVPFLRANSGKVKQKLMRKQ